MRLNHRSMRSFLKDFQHQLCKLRWKGDHSARILITGCGRSGTNYVAKVLNELGLPFSHEGYPRRGIAAWPLAVDTSEPMPWWMAFKQGELAFSPIFHQVRHPLHVIHSVQTFSEESWHYIGKFVPICDNDTLLCKSMKYYYHWNSLAEKKAEWTYRVETFADVLPEFCKRIGREDLLDKVDAVNAMPKNINTRDRGHSARKGKISENYVSWDGLASEDEDLTSAIKSQAIGYGYEI